jgi:hypothetical protein
MSLPGLPPPATDVSIELWRAVEATLRVSTNVLVDTPLEHTELERLLDQVQPAPPLPVALHWLLWTPFRSPPLPGGSRFRGPTDAGVWYGADERRTSCAELGYWRWRFLLASPELTALPATPQTLYQVAVGGPSLDLRQAPLVARRAEWTAPDHYGACQALAREARLGGVQLLRYESVRDPGHGGAVLFTPEAFESSVPLQMQSWFLQVNRSRVTFIRAATPSDEAFDFAFA